MVYSCSTGYAVVGVWLRVVQLAMPCQPKRHACSCNVQGDNRVMRSAVAQFDLSCCQCHLVAQTTYSGPHMNDQLYVHMAVQECCLSVLQHFIV
jgi:hypothetical protein